MHKRPIAIALAIAGIVAGASGIAAVNSDSTESSANVVGPVAVQEVAQAHAEVLNTEQQSQGHITTAPAAATAAATTTTAPDAARTSDQPDAKFVRIPFTNIQLRVIPTPTFPSSAMDVEGPSPAILAYFDRRNANVVLTGAKGPIFPTSGDDPMLPHPFTVAYWERIEAQRLAAANPPAASTAMADAPADVSSSNVAQNSTQLPGT